MYDTIAHYKRHAARFDRPLQRRGDTVNLTLNNFPDNGIAYVRYAPGIKTMGEMKTEGTTVAKGQSSYSVSGLSAGWYTFFVQTDKRDYLQSTLICIIKRGQDRKMKQIKRIISFALMLAMLVSFVPSLGFCGRRKHIYNFQRLFNIHV